MDQPGLRFPTNVATGIVTNVPPAPTNKPKPNAACEKCGDWGWTRRGSLGGTCELCDCAAAQAIRDRYRPVDETPPDR